MVLPFAIDAEVPCRPRTAGKMNAPINIPHQCCSRYAWLACGLCRGAVGADAMNPTTVVATVMADSLKDFRAGSNPAHRCSQKMLHLLNCLPPNYNVVQYGWGRGGISPSRAPGSIPLRFPTGP